MLLIILNLPKLLASFLQMMNAIYHIAFLQTVSQNIIAHAWQARVKKVDLLSRLTNIVLAFGVDWNGLSYPVCQILSISFLLIF